MTVVNFLFPRTALGLTVTVFRNGAQHSTGTLTSAVSSGDFYVYSATTDDATDVPPTYYTAQVSSTLLGTIQAQGSVDTLATIADTPGAAETAYFIATGVTGATDGAFISGANFVADDRFGALPEWVSLVNGDPVIGAAGGVCDVDAIVRAAFDFSSTTPPDSPDEIGAYFRILKDGDTGTTVTPITPPGQYVAADGEDEQSITSPEGGGSTYGPCTITVEPAADGGAVTDGEATFTIALNITRRAPAPTLPA